MEVELWWRVLRCLDPKPNPLQEVGNRDNLQAAHRIMRIAVGAQTDTPESFRWALL